MSTVVTRTYGITGVAPLFTVDPTEQAFFERPETRAWWQMPHGNILTARRMWLDRQRKIEAEATSTGNAMPTAAGSYIVSPNTLNAEVLLTEQGVINPALDWSIWAVALPGTSADSAAIGIVGNDGGVLSLRMRSGDSAQVVTFNGAGAGTIALSGTMTSADHHLVVSSYRADGDLLRIHVDGAQVAAVAGWSPPTNITGRLSLLGSWDLTGGKRDVARNLRLFAAGAAQVFAPGSEWETALEAMVAAKFDTLVTLT